MYTHSWLCEAVNYSYCKGGEKMKQILKKKNKPIFAKVSLYVSENCELPDQITMFDEGCCR